MQALLKVLARVTLGLMPPCIRTDATLHSAQCNLTLGQISLAGMLLKMARCLQTTAGCPQVMAGCPQVMAEFLQVMAECLQVMAECLQVMAECLQVMAECLAVSTVTIIHERNAGRAMTARLCALCPMGVASRPAMPLRSQDMTIVRNSLEEVFPHDKCSFGNMGGKRISSGTAGACHRRASAYTMP